MRPTVCVSFIADDFQEIIANLNTHGPSLDHVRHMHRQLDINLQVVVGLQIYQRNLFTR